MTCTSRSRAIPAASRQAVIVRRARTRRLTAAVWIGAIWLGLSISLPAHASAAPTPTPLQRDPGSFLGVLDSLHTSILTIVAMPDAPAGAKKKRLIGTGVAASAQDVV